MTGSTRRPPGARLAAAVLAGLGAWLGVAQSPGAPPAVLAGAWAATGSSGIARFVERTTLGTFEPGVSTLATSSSVGSIDFRSEQIALSTAVRQAGLTPQRSTSFLEPGTLYERTELGARRTWTEQPSVADPLLSVPALAALRGELSRTPRRVGSGSVGGVPTTEFALEVTTVCSLGRAAGDRFESRTTLWVDHRQRIRRVVFTQQSVLGFGTAAPHDYLTASVVTLGGFGRPMLFGRPTGALHLADRRAPGSPAPSEGSPCSTVAPVQP